MIPELRGYELIFRTSDALFLRALDGMTDESARRKPGNMNSPMWIAAHMTVTRGLFLGAIGGKVDIAWAKHFQRGGEHGDGAGWPSLADVRAKWSEVHAAFMAALERQTMDGLKVETPVPGLEPTLFGVVGLAAVHDSYHLGQLAMCRRELGLERLVG
ncbi:MAG: DinB family protein [Candidatus Eisenbacteria bacterium]